MLARSIEVQMNRQASRDSGGNIRQREITFRRVRKQIQGMRRKREIMKAMNRCSNFQGAFELTDPPDLQRLPHH